MNKNKRRAGREEAARNERQHQQRLAFRELEALGYTCTTYGALVRPDSTVINVDCLTELARLKCP